VATPRQVSRQARRNSPSTQQGRAVRSVALVARLAHARRDHGSRAIRVAFARGWPSRTYTSSRRAHSRTAASALSRPSWDS
jgi:hypothetical protein